MDKSQAIDAIRGSALAQHGDVLIENLAPSARINVDEDAKVSDDNAILSYFGGLPKVPKGAEWPLWDNRNLLKAKIARLEDRFRKNPRATGLRDIAANMRKNFPNGPTPLAFLAQLDLAQLAATAPLDGWPMAGTLLFFYGGEWGFDPLEKGNCCVLYFPAGTSLIERNGPGELGENRRFLKRAVSFRQEWTLPACPRKDWPRDDYFALRDQLISRIEPIHRAGGHPEEVQGEMRLECQLVTNGIYCGDVNGYRDPRAESLGPGATNWKLLLQLDSDDKVGWMWGDVGRVYFWAMQQEIVACDFDNAWAILQCY